MIYILNLVVSCLYLSQIREKRLVAFLFKAFPVLLIWTLIVGGQYFVGADYLQYYNYFLNPNIISRFEPLFTITSHALYNYGFNGQAPFFFFALLNAIVIFIAAFRLEIKYWAIFYFLLVTVSTFFNNQMNGIRQCIAVTFVFWGFVELYRSKVFGSLLIVIAAGFHYTAIGCLLFLLLEKTTNIATRFPRMLLLLSIAISFMPSNDLLNSQILSFLPNSVVESTSYEAMYENNDMTSASTGFIYKLSKLILVPVYWYALRLLKMNMLTEKETLFFRFGLLSFSLRCVLLINNLIGRFSYYFWIPSILPIYYLAVHFWKRKNIAALLLLLVYCSIAYFVKIALGQNEYKSSFIYFQ